MIFDDRQGKRFVNSQSPVHVHCEDVGRKKPRCVTDVPLKLVAECPALLRDGCSQKFDRLVNGKEPVPKRSLVGRREFVDQQWVERKFERLVIHH